MVTCIIPFTLWDHLICIIPKGSKVLNSHRPTSTNPLHCLAMIIATHNVFLGLLLSQSWSKWGKGVLEGLPNLPIPWWYASDIREKKPSQVLIVFIGFFQNQQVSVGNARIRGILTLLKTRSHVYHPFLWRIIWDVYHQPLRIQISTLCLFHWKISVVVSLRISKQIQQSSW